MYPSKKHHSLIETEDVSENDLAPGDMGPEDRPQRAESSEEQPEASLELQKMGPAQLPVGIASGDLTVGLHRTSTTRLWATAAGFALVLTILTAAGIYLITRKPSTVDQLVIQTFPSGANITLDSKEYGHSPVKLEKVPIGRYTITITKEGYDPVEEEIEVTEEETQPRVYRLKTVSTTNARGLSPEEQMKMYQKGASDSFAIRHYAIPFEGSALSYTESMLETEGNNQFALEMRELIRKAMHQDAQGELAKGDLGRAQEVYKVLVDYYPEDADAKTAANRLENQLYSRKGEVRDLVAKAQEALSSGRLVEPERASAYYFSRQVLARDRQNQEARAVLERVKESLSAESEQSYTRDQAAAIKQMERVTHLFPDDRAARTRLRELQTRRSEEFRLANDPRTHRITGLQKAAAGDFDGAIPDLEYALTNDQGTADVVAALARSYHKLGNYDQAVEYYRKVPPGAGSAYRTAIASMGDIAMARKDTATALARYKQALQLGGSTLYSTELLQDKIDRIENQQRAKEAEPVPLTIHVTHLHGAFKGTCNGVLSVGSTGVRYEGRGDHTFSSNLAGMSAIVSRDKLILGFPKKSEFKCSGGDSERFREALARYQSAR